MRVIATPSLWHAFSAEAAHVVHSEGCPSSRNQARLPLRYWESQLFHGGAANETHAHVQHCVRASPWGGPKLTRYTPVKRGIPLLLQGIVGRIAQSLAVSSSTPAQSEPAESIVLPFTVSEEVVTSAIEAWRRRSSYLPAELLSDPAWGMLLELFQAELQDRRVSVSRLCQVSAVSARIAARWLRALERQGLVVRRSDPRHPDDEFVEVSRQGSSALRRYFHGVVQSH